MSAATKAQALLRPARTLAALLAAAAFISPAAALAWQDKATEEGIIPVSLGDVTKVTGAPIGCIVRLQNGERALDCRRAGALTGSYGTIITGSQVLVVRFESPKVAKIVFQARHGKLRVHTCGG
jgi:hypothetical protein